MERLTRRLNNNKIVAIKGDSCNYSANSFDCQLSEGRKRLKTALEKLADYEDLEEQGLLVRLPCKVGTEVFAILPRDSHCTKCQIKKIEIRPTIFGKICYFAEPVAQRGCCFRYFDTEFGKVIFLTREEAEKKLEEMRNDKI